MHLAEQKKKKFESREGLQLVLTDPNTWII